MRITESFRNRVVIGNLNTSRQRLTELQEQLASAKRINRPSDDPLGTANSLRIRNILDSNEQYEANINDIVGHLTASESALEDLHNVLLELKDIATRGANDSIVDKQDLAQQVNLILDNMLELANTKWNGKYIFGGTETLYKPFVLNTNVRNLGQTGDIVNYYGNSNEIDRQINENTYVAANLPGDKVFINTVAGGIDIFGKVWELKENLEAEDTDSVRSSIDSMNDSIDQVLNSFLEVGTRKQLALFNKERFQVQNIQLKSKLSNIEDTDYAEAFVLFKVEENALNSALSAGARVVSPSLGDFLGI